ncbi:MAG: ABC transporter permease subunit [Flavobacteriales bacterium]|nr:ABC transporter permease subunit [Flavobacteriales bacterium]
MNKMLKYIIADILRTKVMIGYMVLLFVISFVVFASESNASKGVLTMMSIVLFMVPLVSVLFSAIYLYNSAEFIELMLSQPINRSQVWIGMYTGLGLSLIIAFCVGFGVPMLLFASNHGWVLFVSGIFLTACFSGIGLLASVKVRDKARGIGTVLMIWIFFAIIFDGMVLFLSFQLADYPLEKPMMIMSALNPVDLARIFVLLAMNISALLGYTGAVFNAYLGSGLGRLICATVLLGWCILPYWISLKWFKKKDL